MVTKKKVTQKPAKAAASTAAKTERPTRGQSRAKGRPERRRSIGEHRDMLSTENLDPEYIYRWVLGATENDKRIVFSLRDGWEMVDQTKEPNLVVGDYAVGRSTTLGSIYRIPAARRSTDEYLYLMRMPLDYAREVHEWEQDEVDKTEEALTAPRSPDDNEGGQYGGTKVEHGFVTRPTRT